MCKTSELPQYLDAQDVILGLLKGDFAKAHSHYGALFYKLQDNKIYYRGPQDIQWWHTSTPSALNKVEYFIHPDAICFPGGTTLEGSTECFFPKNEGPMYTEGEVYKNLIKGYIACSQQGFQYRLIQDPLGRNGMTLQTREAFADWQKSYRTGFDNITHFIDPITPQKTKKSDIYKELDSVAQYFREGAQLINNIKYIL